MSERVTTVTRETLYEQVWTTPMTRLAEQYGVSGGALAKTCRKLGVPVPQRGHWAKLQHGKKVPPRPKLPPISGERRNAATVTRTQPASAPEMTDPVVQACAQSLADDANRIKVADQLRDPHPAVRAPFPKPGTLPKGAAAQVDLKTLPMKVSDGSRGRALRILDALAKALEARGYKVTAEGARIEGETVPIAITEKDERQPHIATAAEHKRREAYSWERIPDWDYVPTGRLSIHSECYGCWDSNLRKRWSDGRSGQLEDRLDDVLLGLVTLGASLRRRTDELRAQSLRFEEEQRVRAEHERQARVDAARAANILASARSLNDAELVRALIVRMQGQVSPNTDEWPSGLQAWLQCATVLADELDPTSDGASVLLERHEAAANEGGLPRSSIGLIGSR